MIAGKQRRFGQLVLLGAGYDTRCARLNSLLVTHGAKCIELDQPQIQQQKERWLGAESVKTHQFVPADFRRDDWLVGLINSESFDPTLPSIFVMEGVTMYLSRDDLRRTIQRLSSAQPHSILIADFVAVPSGSLDLTEIDSATQVEKAWRQQIQIGECDSFDLSKIAKDVQLLGEPFKGAWSGDAIAQLGGKFGWTVRKLFGPKQIKERYLSKLGGMQIQPSCAYAMISMELQAGSSHRTVH